MTILVVGHRSMLARALLPCLQQTGFEVRGRGRPELDITQDAHIRRALDTVQPELVVNTAAYTAVDRAESDPAAAFAVNRDGPALLASACRPRGIPLLHVSTDYVFDGTATRPYREEDAAAPLSIYGRSKWEGEQAVRTAQPDHLILRTAWLYGAHGSNFVMTIVRLARDRQAVRVVNDQYGCPTWTRDLAATIAAICQRLARGLREAMWGTYHWCGAGTVSRFEFARAILEEAGQYESVCADWVEPIPTAALPTPAKRPASAILDCSKVHAIFGLTPRPWRDSLSDCLREYCA